MLMYAFSMQVFNNLKNDEPADYFSEMASYLFFE
jgi:hypothetical protein